MHYPGISPHNKIDEDKFFLDQLKTNLRTKSYQFTSKYIQELIQALERKIKIYTNFQQHIQNFLNIFIAHHSCSTPADININALFYRIIAMPTALQEDNSGEWNFYYKLVKTQEQESREWKLHFLVGMIDYKYREQILQGKNKLWSLLTKAIEKEFSAVAIPILTIYYYFSVHRSLLYRSALQIEPLYQILTSIYLKNKGILALTFSKLLSELSQKQWLFNTFLIATLGLMINLNSKSINLIDSFVINKNARNRLFSNDYQWSNAKQIYLKDFFFVKCHQECSTINAIFILYGQFLLKNADDPTTFTKIISKTKEYFSAVPGLFTKIIDKISYFLATSDMFINIPTQESVLDELIDKFAEDQQILTLICILHRKSKRLSEELGKSVKRENLVCVVETFIEYGFYQDLNGENENVMDVILDHYNQGNDHRLEKTVLKKLLWIQNNIDHLRRESKIQQLIDPLRKLKPAQYENSSITTIQTIHQEMINLYLNNFLSLTTILKMIKKVFDQQKMIHLFLNILLKTMMQTPREVLNEEESNISETNPVSDILFSVLNMSIHSKRNKILSEHPFIQKGIDLIESMTEYSEIMRKIFRFHLDRPSEVYMENQILKNRFLIRYIFVSKVAGAIKTIYAIVSEMENKDRVLETIFPKIQDTEARRVYLKYLHAKDLVQFRLEMQKHQEWKEWMVQE